MLDVATERHGLSSDKRNLLVAPTISSKYFALKEILVSSKAYVMSHVLCIGYNINDVFAVLNYYSLRLSLQAKSFNMVAKQSVEDAIRHDHK